MYSDPVNRAEFKRLALTRLEDAKVLLKNRRHSAAYYTAGYVVEYALKACLARKARRYDFPPMPDVVRNKYYTHKLEILAQQSGLLGQLQQGSPRLQAYWTTVKDWKSDSRYDPHAGRRAKDILLAIEDATDGVLQCLKRYW